MTSTRPKLSDVHTFPRTRLSENILTLCDPKAMVLDSRCVVAWVSRGKSLSLENNIKTLNTILGVNDLKLQEARRVVPDYLWQWTKELSTWKATCLGTTEDTSELDAANQNHFHTSASQCVEPIRKNKSIFKGQNTNHFLPRTRPSQLYKYLPLTTKNSFSLPSINFQVNRYSKLHTSHTQPTLF